METKKVIDFKFEIHQGANLGFFVKLNGKLLGGFPDEEDAKLFVRAKRFKIYQDANIPLPVDPSE